MTRTIALLVLTWSGLAAQAKPIVLKDYRISAPQLTEEGQLRNECYILAAQGTDAGEDFGPMPMDYLPKLLNVNQIPIYKLTKFSSGLICRVLKNPGANDVEWASGGPRLDGCSCAGDLEIER